MVVHFVSIASRTTSALLVLSGQSVADPRRNKLQLPVIVSPDA
jgi:hypothetical protein